MLCCRVFAFVLLLIATACGVCSSLFPLFRATESDTVLNIFYWYTETVTPGTNGSGTITVRHYNQDRVCLQNRTNFVAAAALSTAGAALGGIATLLAAMWVCGRRLCLHHFITSVTFLSLACFAVTVALIVFSFLEGTCKDSAANTSAIQDMQPKYEFGVGFMLMSVAAGGMLISFVYVVCSYCCYDGTCCCPNNNDYVDYEDDVSERRQRLDSKATSRHGSMSRRSSMSRQRTNSSMSRGSHHRRSRSASMYE